MIGINMETGTLVDTTGLSLWPVWPNDATLPEHLNPSRVGLFQAFLSQQMGLSQTPPSLADKAAASAMDNTADEGTADVPAREKGPVDWMLPGPHATASATTLIQAPIIAPTTTQGIVQTEGATGVQADGRPLTLRGVTALPAHGDEPICLPETFPLHHKGEARARGLADQPAPSGQPSPRAPAPAADTTPPFTATPKTPLPAQATAAHMEEVWVHMNPHPAPAEPQPIGRAVSQETLPNTASTVATMPRELPADHSDTRETVANLDVTTSQAPNESGHPHIPDRPDETEQPVLRADRPTLRPWVQLLRSTTTDRANPPATGTPVTPTPAQQPLAAKPATVASPVEMVTLRQVGGEDTPARLTHEERTEQVKPTPDVALSTSQAVSMTPTRGTIPMPPSDKAAQPDLPTLVASLTERIQVAVTRGESKWYMKLNPPTLGRLDVELRFAGETLTVHMTAQHPAARGLLESNLNELRSQLSERGLQVGDLQINIAPEHGAGLTFSSGESRSWQEYNRQSQFTNLPLVEKATKSPAATHLISVRSIHNGHIDLWV